MMDTSHILCGYMYPMTLTISKEPYKCHNIDATANSLPLLLSRRIRPSCSFYHLPLLLFSNSKNILQFPPSWDQKKKKQQNSNSNSEVITHVEIMYPSKFGN